MARRRKQGELTDQAQPSEAAESAAVSPGTLIDTEVVTGGQIELFGRGDFGGELLAVPVGGSRPHTGELAERDWEKVQRILECDAAGVTMREVCRRFAISPNTLIRLRQKHGSATAETWRQRMQGLLRGGAQALAERLIADVDVLPSNIVPVAMGIMVDKLGGLETGLGGEEGGSKGAAPTPEDFNAWCDDLVAKVKVAKVSKVETPASQSDASNAQPVDIQRS